MKTGHTTTSASYRAGPALFTLLCTAAMVTASLLPGYVHASDRKNFPGTMCKPYNSSSNNYAYSSSGIRNTSSSSSLSVYCPVVRDNTLNTNGIDWAKVSYSQSPSTNYRLSCTLYSKTSTGRTVDSHYKSLTHYETGYGALYFDLDESARYGNFNVYCRVPPYSMINGIHVVEH